MHHHRYVADAGPGFAGRGAQPAARRLARRIRLAVGVAVIGLAFSGCGAAPAPSPTPTTGPTASGGPPASAGASSSSAPGGVGIVLDRVPAGLGCDAIGVEYRSVTFFIDPASQPAVWAVTDRGRRLAVGWDPSFVGGPVADPSVLDATGAVVARPGEVLVIPQGAWPSLHGHFACPSPTALYVLDQPAPR